MFFLGISFLNTELILPKAKRNKCKALLTHFRSIFHFYSAKIVGKPAVFWRFQGVWKRRTLVWNGLKTILNPILKIKDKSEALVHFNFKLTHFMALVSFLYPLKTEHLYFSDIFRRYRKRPLSWNRLRETFGINQGGGNLNLIEINCKLSTVNLGAANRISLYENWPKCENLTSRRFLASHSNVSRSKNFASESFKSSNPSSVPLAGISFNSRYIEFCFTWDETCRKPRMSQITLARDCSSAIVKWVCQSSKIYSMPRCIWWGFPFTKYFKRV